MTTDNHTLNQAIAGQIAQLSRVRRRPHFRRRPLRYPVFLLAYGAGVVTGWLLGLWIGGGG